MILVVIAAAVSSSVLVSGGAGQTPRRHKLLLAFVFLGLFAVTSAGATSRTQTPITETATAANVQASLSYMKVVDNGLTSYRNLRIAISRDGHPVSGTPPTRGSIDLLWPGNSFQKNSKSVHVLDLDGDGEPEVTFDLYSGGAHCCHMFWAYRWNGTAYVSQEFQSGSAPYSQRDLNNDGKPEWVTADPRFEYLFTSFAGSGFPLRIYTYQGPKFAIVTRTYPKLVRNDQARWWRFYLQQRKQPPSFRDVRGVLAAWAADTCLLGQSAKVWPALNTALARGELRADRNGPGGRAYIGKLKQKLRAFGYL